MPKALEKIYQYLQGVYGAHTPLHASILHGQFADQAALLSALLSDKLNVVKSEILRISPVLGVHTGPGIVGATVVPQELLEGIA